MKPEEGLGGGDLLLGGLDIAVFVLYIIVLLVIGGVVSYRHRKSEDLFLGGRSMGWWNVGLSIFGTNIGPAFLIATCGAGYTSGMVTANFEWMAWVFLFLLGMVFVPFYLNTKISTMPEFLLKRFGPGCYHFSSVYALFGTVVMWIGVTLFAGGALLSQLLGWDLMVSLLALSALAASFTIAGGLAAVMVTDSFQSILMIAGAGALSLVAATHIESFEALRNVTCGDTPSELTWKLFHPSDSGNPWYAFVLGYPVLAIWFWCSDQTIVQRALGARDLKQAQAGTLFCGFLKIVPPFIFLLPGIFAAILMPGIQDDKQVFVQMVTAYLPAGMVGLIVAVLVAAVISTLDSGLNSFSTIYTLDFHRRWISPDASEHRLKQVGRIATVVAAGIGVGMAWLLSKAEGTNLFNLMQGIIGYIAPPIAATFCLGILWHRATAKAALTTLVFGSIVSLAIGICDITNVFADEAGNDIWPHFLLLSFILFVGMCVLMVVVSLGTRHDDCEIALPTLRETYRQNRGLGVPGFVGWGILAVIMLALYLFFHFAMTPATTAPHDPQQSTAPVDHYELGDDERGDL